MSRKPMKRYLRWMPALITLLAFAAAAQIDHGSHVLLALVALLEMALKGGLKSGEERD